MDPLPAAFMGEASEEVTPRMLKKVVGHRVEIVAFGIAYQGKLKKIDLGAGTVKICDRGNEAVVEIERIVSFRTLDD